MPPPGTRGLDDRVTTAGAARLYRTAAPGNRPQTITHRFGDQCGRPPTDVESEPADSGHHAPERAHSCASSSAASP